MSAESGERPTVDHAGSEPTCEHCGGAEPDKAYCRCKDCDWIVYLRRDEGETLAAFSDRVQIWALTLTHPCPGGVDQHGRL